MKNLLMQNLLIINLVSKTTSQFVKILAITATLISTFTFSNVTHAGIETMIKNVMPKGTMSNVTRGAIVKDQLSGHLIGGSIMIKSPVNDELQMISARAPKLCMSGLPCTRQIDLRMGALSFIKSKEMTSFLKNMLASVGTYGAVMAIKTICPHCEDLMTWLEGVQRDMNKFGALTCQALIKPIAGTFAKLEAAAEANRQSNMVTTAEKSDMLHTGDKARKSLDDEDPTPNNQHLKEQLGDKFNLVWKALAVKAETGSMTPDRSLRELLMSISGTVIVNKDTKPIAINLVSLASEDLIEQYIGTSKGSSDIELYVCDEQVRCLDPKPERVRISAKDTLYGRIDRLIVSIVKKVKENKSDFTEEEDELIALSTIPLTNKIQLDLATHPDSAEASSRMNEFIEAICYDVVTSHFTKLLQTVDKAVGQLSYQQHTESGVFERFENEIRDVRTMLNGNRELVLKRYNIISQTRMRMRQEESYFESKFEEHIGNSFIRG